MNNDTDVLAFSDADELPIPILSRAEEDSLLDKTNAKLLAMREQLQNTHDAPPMFRAPPSVPVVASVVPIRRTSQQARPRVAGNQCPECPRYGRKPTPLNHPGICFECEKANRSEAATSRLALANGSIHAERKWARFDSGLLSERLDPLSWTLSIGGRLQCNGHDLASLCVQMPVIASASRLVIAGVKTGIGKTAFATALMQATIDSAHADMCRENVEPSPHGEGARFVAVIDLLDPVIAKLACNAPFALIDNAGQEGRQGGWRAQESFKATGDVLDRRERTTRKRTIVTSYLTRDQWGDSYGGYVTRLYWDMPSAVVIEMWNDR